MDPIFLMLSEDTVTVDSCNPQACWMPHGIKSELAWTWFFAWFLLKKCQIDKNDSCAAIEISESSNHKQPGCCTSWNNGVMADIVTALYGFCMIKLSAATRGKFTSFFKLFARSTVVKLHQEIKTRICILSWRKSSESRQLLCDRRLIAEIYGIYCRWEAWVLEEMFINFCFANVTPWASGNLWRNHPCTKWLKRKRKAGWFPSDFYT